MSNSLHPDQARQFVGPDLGSNCLQRLSADDTSSHSRIWYISLTQYSYSHKEAHGETKLFSGFCWHLMVYLLCRLQHLHCMYFCPSVTPLTHSNLMDIYILINWRSLHLGVSINEEKNNVSRFTGCLFKSFKHQLQVRLSSVKPLRHIF